MGRTAKVFDMDALFDLAEAGYNSTEIAQILDTSISTIGKRIRELRDKQAVLLDYRSVESLRMTEVRIKVLDAITDDKIANADLKDLVYAMKILKDKEMAIELGGPSEMRGLLAHLIYLEKEEMKKLPPIDIESDQDDTGFMNGT